MSNLQSSVPPRRKRKIWIVLAAVIVIVIVIAGVFYAANRSTAAPTPPSGPNVTIWDTGFCSNTGNCGYSPVAKSVTSGAGLTWTNTGGQPHTASECTTSDTSNVCPNGAGSNTSMSRAFERVKCSLTTSTLRVPSTTIALFTLGCMGPLSSARRWKREGASPELKGEGELSPNTRPLSIATVVPIVGLSYFACFSTGLILRSLISNGSLASYQIFFIPLASLAALCAATVWWRPRIGYVAAAVMSIVLVAIFFLTRDGNDVITVLSNPARNHVQFAFYITSVPQFFSTLAFSILGLWRSK